MQLSKIVFEVEGATLTLERVPTNAIKATWEAGTSVNQGEPWSNSFDIDTMSNVRNAANEILMMYHGERREAMGDANVSSDELFAFGLKLLELGRS